MSIKKRPIQVRQMPNPKLTQMLRLSVVVAMGKRTTVSVESPMLLMLLSIRGQNVRYCRFLLTSISGCLRICFSTLILDRLITRGLSSSKTFLSFPSLTVLDLSCRPPANDRKDESHIVDDDALLHFLKRRLEVGSCL